MALQPGTARRIAPGQFGQPDCGHPDRADLAIFDLEVVHQEVVHQEVWDRALAGLLTDRHSYRRHRQMPPARQKGCRSAVASQGPCPLAQAEVPPVRWVVGRVVRRRIHYQTILT
jgi:hypothetical protein